MSWFVFVDCLAVQEEDIAHFMLVTMEADEVRFIGFLEEQDVAEH